MKRSVPAGAAIVAGLLAGQGWLLSRLVRQNGQLLLRLEALEAQMLSNRRGRSRPGGLPVGSKAPEFTLPDLDGRARALRDFLARPLLVIFFSSRCDDCLELAPHLGLLPAGGPRVLVLARGEPAEYRRLIVDHRWTCDVVVERGLEVSRRYCAEGTPAGYLLYSDGRVASPQAVGVAALLRLASAWLPRDDRAGGRPGFLTPEWFAEHQRGAAPHPRLDGLRVHAGRSAHAGQP